MRLLWLPSVLRAAGLDVVEHAGWQTRAAGSTWDPEYGVVHATAAPRSQADDVQVRIVRDGREGLPGPIANACVDRRGRWHVLAAGRCNTTLPGTAGPYAGRGNTSALGVEACNDNRSEPWPEVQYRAYVRGWAAIARRLGWAPSRLRGHREHTPGHKTDPTFDMAKFRGDVAAVLAGEDDDMPTVEEIVTGLLRANVGSSGPTVGLHLEQTRDTVITLPAKLDAVLAAVAGVDEEVLAKLGSAEQTPEQAAALLRPVLGDRAEAVGRVLAGLTAE